MIKDILIGFGFGAFTGAISMALILKSLIGSDIRIGKIKDSEGIDLNQTNKRRLFGHGKKNN